MTEGNPRAIPFKDRIKHTERVMAAFTDADQVADMDAVVHGHEMLDELRKKGERDLGLNHQSLQIAREMFASQLPPDKVDEDPVIQLIDQQLEFSGNQVVVYQSMGKEIEQMGGYRAKLDELDRREIERRKNLYPDCADGIPPGIFNSRQLERYNRFNTCVTETTNEFADENDIDVHVTRRLADKMVLVDFYLGRDNESNGERMYLPFQYRPGGRFTKETFDMNPLVSIPLLIPLEERESVYDVDKAYDYLFSPDADSRGSAHFLIEDVSPEKIRKLLTVAAVVGDYMEPPAERR